MSSHDLDLAYRQVWNAFTASSETVDGRHDTDLWRSHAGPFALCIVRVPVEILQPELSRLRRDLTETPGLRLHPDHFLHITLQELGFVVEFPGQPDEIFPARLEEFAQAAVEPASSSQPFTIELGGANAFQDALFLEVRHGHPLRQLHEQLFDLAAMPNAPAYPFLPHCTLAHYDAATATAHSRSAILPWRDAVLGDFAVTEIEIVTLDPTEPYPELESYAVLPLGT